MANEFFLKYKHSIIRNNINFFFKSKFENFARFYFTNLLFKTIIIKKNYLRLFKFKKELKFNKSLQNE